ncbi:acyl-ACP--UDP-N-acetylglucosamine O-acyltransferase [Pontibacter sp. BT310]|jgi:UDP-N-acetylglucosamine acyltransferase|uniref:Acyl-ACP--UDP-N-acetylglucosamine O-acyltransferase n=1 Tax=Pontibacter populi TaxID=890055 RepID=A0ABS6XDE1_9BACT|nr:MULTISPECIES: acyl-ACP--UDP-N-acetylglucosamine O-acyltransferase [Pontibacter]MBJ6118669.1 acyl-ACP--UDP-N-acetylglucosamine O-acyltransferase [Pontibacter sp. BT310]MBR0571098.1 acyl-ACP--UDP-N-acetylglucosamine O-acyltransferase [Microvirga sp. STS03]MBW3365523.1 acyl-ACP--UDP-N-acetylglucosamine O-acyltransferase [Pontibacter populi]
MNQPLAYIHPEAKIAHNVVIEPFSTIYKNVEIGEGTWIGPNVTIMEGARIGKNCKIFPGAVISSVPQDLKFAGEETTAVIGDNTVIRECVTVSRGTIDKMRTVVGSNCLIMSYAHIAHDCIVGNNCIVVNAVQMAGHVEMGDFAIIGGSSAVHQFVKIGAHAMISGGSLVRKDVPPYVKAAREPLTYAGINSIGLRRRGFTSEQINEVQQLYRTLFMSGYNTTEALDKIELDMAPSKERDEIVNFVRNSGRGIIKSYIGKDAN